MHESALTAAYRRYLADLYSCTLKLLYTILFFSGLASFIALTYYLLKMIDSGKNALTLAGMSGGIIASIAILIYCLLHYIKLPPSRPRGEN